VQVVGRGDGQAGVRGRSAAGRGERRGRGDLETDTELLQKNPARDSFLSGVINGCFMNGGSYD
jgi:hypothetical protein